MAVKQNERKTDSDTTDESESLEESFVNLLKEFTEVTSHEDDSADDSSSDEDSADDSSSDEDSADDSSDDEDSADDLLDDDDDAPSGLETGAWLDDNDDSDPSSQGSNAKTHDDPPQARVLNYIKDSRQRLDELVGLDDIKRHIKDMINLSQFNLKKWEYDPQAKLHDVNLHSIFCGPVGVGKTTVAQLYSSLLHDAGVLSKGHVVICDRGTFIGRLWGDEERRVAKVLDMARGGVLFIDEAYLLSTSNPNDPGRIVLPSMLNLLADESQRDIAVVLAGYDKPMENLLSLNPGLASRFVNRFHFKPFTVDELMEITTRKNAPYHYTFSDEALAAYRKLVEKAHKTKGSTFGNGRFVANLLEKIYIRHASRCMDNNLAGKDLMVITPADIPTEYNAEDDERHVGFR